MASFSLMSRVFDIRGIFQMYNIRTNAVVALGTVLLLAASGARAAGPIELEQPQGQILLGVDETKLLKFDSPVSRVEIRVEGLVNAVPQSDTQIRFTGVSTGRSSIIVYGPGGARIYSGMLAVTSEPGHLVRIFRAPTREEMTAAAKGDGKVDASDEYWCTSTSCNNSARVTSNPDHGR